MYTTQPLKYLYIVLAKLLPRSKVISKIGPSKIGVLFLGSTELNKRFANNGSSDSPLVDQQTAMQ